MAVLLGVGSLANSGISVRPCWAMFNPPPPNKEAIIEQARTSLWSVLSKSLRRRSVETVPVRKFTSRRQQMKKQKQERLRVEIPIGDGSGESVAGLLLLLLEAVRTKITGRVCVVVRTESILDGVFKQIEEVDGFRFLPDLQLASLEDGDKFEPEEDVSLVVFVGPGPEDLESQRLKRYVARCGKDGRVLVLLNPEWNSMDEGDNLELCKSFQVVYAYTPLDIKVFYFSLIKGAVFKPDVNEPWRVFLKEGDKMKCMLSKQERPMDKDLEPLFYNFLAANSLPVRFVKFVKGIFQKDAKKSG